MSRLIKSQFTVATTLADRKLISVKPIQLEYKDSGEKEEAEKSDFDLAYIEKLKSEAEELLHSAKSEAEKIRTETEQYRQEVKIKLEKEREDWLEEKEKLTEQSIQNGYSEGLQQGKQDGFLEYKGLIEEAKRVVELANMDYQKHIDDSETSILHLAMKCSEKILHHELESNPDAFAHIVKSVMKEVKDYENIQIHVHPTFYELVLAEQEDLKNLLTNPLVAMYIYPDDELDPTSCIVESSFGRIDASIDSQLQELKIKLLELHNGEQR